MFRKELVESSEWVIDIGGQTIPLKAVTAPIEAFLCIIIAYFMFNAGAWTAMLTLDYVSTPKSVCGPTGDCTYCIPYADGSHIAFNCTSVNIVTSRKALDYAFVTNKTLNITVR